MTTIYDLMNLFSASYGAISRPTIYAYDKTGNVDLGVYRKGDDIPTWFKFVGVERFTASDGALFVRVNDFTGDVITRNDDVRAYALGFDYSKEANEYGKYCPEYINVKVDHIAGCEHKVKKLKLTPESFGGYSFKIYGRKYTLADVIRR